MTSSLELVALVAAGLGTALAYLGWRAARRAIHVDGPSLAMRVAAAPLGWIVRPRGEEQIDEVRLFLSQAGNRTENAVRDFTTRQGAALTVGLLSAVLFWKAGWPLLAPLAALAGWRGPKRLAERRRQKRIDRIVSTLPGAVDLLTTCIDAGLSLERAFRRVAGELELVAPELTLEFQTTVNEIDVGMPLPEALRRLGNRTGVEDLSAMCSVLAQTHGLGAPVGRILAEYAETTRRQRLAMLEENAGRVAGKLSLPVGVCFLPAVLILILGPAGIRMIQALHP